MRTHLRRIIAFATAVTAVLLLPALVFAWGDVGHRIIGEAAALRLPGAAPAFLRNASKQLGYLNPEPDRWRSRAESSVDPALDRGTQPDHFIDLEMAPAPVLAAALTARGEEAAGWYAWAWVRRG
jgi:hypothetical protein